MKNILLISAVALSLTACFGAGKSYRDVSKPFTKVSEFDAQKYLGEWYQIARYDAWYEYGCVGDRAEYALINENEISVKNTCNNETVDGPVITSNGSARIEDVGVLTVKFVGGYPKEPNYYVMDIKGDYEIAVVGEPDGTSGWILAREPKLSEYDLNWAKGVLQNAGYDLSELILPAQPGER